MAATQKLSDDKFRCYHCLTVMDRRLARNHVGGHILKAMRHVEEGLAGIPVGSEMPCGFCGRSGISMCSQLYLTAGRSPQPRSDCPHFYAFQYKSSLKSTQTMPCTNTPILCPVPGCTQSTPDKLFTAVWKYNMPQHVRMQHPGYSIDGFEEGTLLPQLLCVMDITHEEEKALGIPEGVIPALKRTDILSQAPSTQGK
ncbi:uncharacterized protein TRAVEDRAFT_132679 [Trametes versicolor FP-101664 SS1]|uniref:uncharacterized protein n=1 Tax=Trametes versicolor (strain FP-101664) TaxID=717944 RepID=UPI0004624916|nr:uncharacterized protein TRAVEDRAFT_132679 [Trametes versicolor FP-101664 SS1]EIW53975.1 hypothetical protein TRAVEDRAFT_132679 [Trametes versicolor FP-101664 SS1]